jgi:hypothetical protein
MAVMPAFWGKLVFVAVGMFVAVKLKRGHLDDESALASGVVTPPMRTLAKISLVCWAFALVIGRLTGYPELVTAWFGI